MLTLKRRSIDDLGKSKYFSLDASHATSRKGVKTITLKKDLARGVQHLSEWSYSKQWGSTNGCLRFFNVLMKNIDVTRTYRAVMKYNPRTQYTLFLHLSDGYTILLKGVSSGYHGEGTRGCYDILLACGFSQEQAQKAFKLEQFECRKLIL